MIHSRLWILLVLSLWLPSAHASAPEFWNPIPNSSQSINNEMFLRRLLPEFLANTQAFDESYNFQPGLNLYNEAGQLTDLFGAHGSQLCAPIAITHGFTYLKYSAGFSRLATVADMDSDGTANTYRDQIRYFFQACETDKENGTFYSKALSCMQNFITTSGYKPYAYMVGPHSVEAPPGYPLETMKHVLTVTDMRTYLSHGLMVLVGVGWYEFDAATASYKRTGGHFVNAYGYDYSNTWGESQIRLKIVNSWVDYTGRQRQDMYDDVMMTHLPADGTTYPAETAYELRGNGFQFTQRALVEDIFVALPLQ